MHGTPASVTIVCRSALSLPLGPSRVCRSARGMYADERTVAVKTTKTLGDALREARIDKDIGLREIARQLEKSPSYISDIENDRRVPSEEVLAALARILGLDFENLMALAGRLGADTRRLVERSPEAVSLFRKISGLSPDQRREIAKTVDQISEKKGRKN